MLHGIINEKGRCLDVRYDTLDKMNTNFTRFPINLYYSVPKF